MYFKKIFTNNSNDYATEGNLQLIRSEYKWIELAARLDILEKRGVIESVTNGYPTKNGNPQPLLTFSFMDWFETHDFSQYQLIEYGSGYSTLYFAKYCKEVYSFEQDFNWFNDLKSKLPSNVQYHYLREWHPLPKVKHDNLNITLVDFKGHRYSAIKQLIDEDESQLIILDNSDVYPNSSKLLLDNGYKEITFWGGKLTEHYESCNFRYFNTNLVSARYVFGNLYDKK
jgi:hypothetical protein